MALITTSLFLLGCLLQIQNVIPLHRFVRSASGLEVVAGVDSTDFVEVVYSCNSTSSSNGYENIQGTWLLTCKNVSIQENTVLATFDSTGFHKKHPHVTGGSAKVQFKISTTPEIAHDSGEDSDEEEEEEETDSKTNGPSSTLKVKPICDGNITCKITTGSDDKNAATATVQTMAPLIGTHRRNRTSTGDTDTVTLSCKPKTICDSYNITWYNSSTATKIGSGTFSYSTSKESHGNTTEVINDALTWTGEFVHVNGSKWSEDETNFCLSCEVRSCGLVGMGFVCDGGYRSAFHSSSPPTLVSSCHQTLIVLLGIFLMIC
ncbi:m160 protein [Murid betaherpesvirus 1]|nr:m160 protein [Murid betaherpesvirus 1]